MCVHPIMVETGACLDRLTHTQRTILSHLNIALPWPEQLQN